MIEKSLYEAPEGLESLDAGMDENPDGIEIEIVDPEEVSVKLGDLEIEIGGEEIDDFDENLAEVLPDDVVAKIVTELIEDYEDDVASRKDWMQTYVDGLELLGMKIEERADPWIGACGVYHPLLSEALVKFQAEVMMSTFPAAGPVKTQIIGKETQEKKDAATRVQDDMNYELTDVMTEFRPEHERMLWGLGLSGNAFKKVYFDPNMDRQTSIFVPAEDIVVPYGASDIETSPRVTHVMRKTENDLRKLQVAGFYIDVDLGEPQNNLDEVEKKIAEKMGFRATSDDRYKILEMNVNLDLEGYEHKDKDGEPTGIALPYVVTIEKGSTKCLAIRRNWRPEDKKYKKRQHYVHYGYVPGFGFYCFGLIHLVGAFAKSGTSILRQLVDAGTLSNLPGGFKTRGLRTKGDDTPIGPGEWRDVDVPSGAIKDNIMALPYKEPSQVLAALLDKIVEEGRRFASAADVQVADMSANSPVGTTLAILERSLKVMTAVQARIHYSFKQELGLLRDIIRDYTPEDYAYEPEEGEKSAKRSDYDLVDVIPVSDPNAATMAQKIVQYQAVIQLSQQAPDIYDLPQLHRQMLDVLGIKNAQKLVPLEEDEKPKDPVTENMNMLKDKPLKAFMTQDHDAHITVHTSFLQDPNITSTIAQNPKANQMMAAMQAHIAEHLGFHYRQEIEKQMGVTLPSLDQELPDDVEAELSKLIAQASKQLLEENKAEAQQKKSQELAQDPLVQMQQKDLQLKEEEIKIKAQKVQGDAQAKQQALANETLRIQNQNQVDFARIEADMQKSQQKDSSEQNRERMRLDAEAKRSALQMAVQQTRGNQ
jgi:hypothetical protein